MTGCQDARNAITILEAVCPNCGESIEVFCKDGRVSADSRCEGCGYEIVQDTPAEKLKCD